MGTYDVEPHYGGAIEAAYAVLNKPTTFQDCVSVLLDKGGDNGYWMRLLGNENFDDRRVGSLMVTPDAVAYAELCAHKPKPKSSMGKIAMMSGGGRRVLGLFTWTARRDEISDLAVYPICHSAHVTYAAVEISARGERKRFGIDLGRPDAQSCVSALRHVAGTDHPIHGPSTSEPRTDGIYVFAADSRPQRFGVMAFDGSNAFFLRMTDPAKDLDDFESGKWKPTPWACRVEDDHVVIADDNPELERHAIVLPDGRLVIQADKWYRRPDELGQHTSEFEFVPRAEIVPGWGRPTIPGPLTPPTWPPLLVNGDLLASDLGHPQARVKG